MFSALVSIVGTTTSVRDAGGNPREKSIRGSGRGVTSSVASQFTIPTASWLVASSRTMPSVASSGSPTPSLRATASRAAVRVTVIDRDRAQVEQQGNPPPDPGEGLERGHAHRRRSFELRPPVVDQVEADVGGAIVVAVAAGLAGDAFVRQLDRLARHLAFGQVAPFGDLLDDVPVAIAGREVHPAVEPARILPQLLLDDAHRFDELAPVHRSQKAKAADGVADRDLVAGLLLRLRLHQLLDREARLGQPLLDPGERQGQRGALSLQPARELGDERAHHRRVRARHVRDHQDQALRIVLGDVHHLVRPRVGPVAVDRAGGDPGADAAQVLDQRQPQHDRNGPQLAQLERRHRLVGRHETGEALRVDPAVAVGDRLEREVVDARKPGGGSLRQAGKLAAVPLGQVPLGRADLLVDQVEVVEQPFRGGRDAAIGRDRRGQQVADFEQDAFVLGQARQQPVGRAAGRQPVRGREVLAVLLHLIGAEQLRSQRRFLVGIFAERVGAAEAHRDLEQSLKQRAAAHVQCWFPGRWRNCRGVRRRSISPRPAAAP